MNELQSRLEKPALKRIIHTLPTDIPIYLVGGWIRDAFLDRSNADLDFVTPGDAMKIARSVADKLGGAYFPLDLRRKVARVILDPVEVKEITTESRIKIDFSAYQGKNLDEDLRGRDFTMNAMAIEIHQPDTLVDPLGGLGDLLSRRLKTCSPSSFLDDPVRILRAVRFSVDLELKILPETLQLMKEAIGRIPLVSSERLRDELFKILMQSHPGTAFRILDHLNALKQFLPELSTLKGVEQSEPHIMDVWSHTLAVLDQLELVLSMLADDFDPEKTGNLAMGHMAVRLGRFRPHFQLHFRETLNPDRSLRGLLFLAGLFHDVGKPDTRGMEASGRIRFFEHERVGSELVEKRARELRLSNPEVDRLVTITKHHMRPSLLSHEGQIPSDRAIYRFFRETGAVGVDICVLSLADVLATYGATLPQERWTRHLDTIQAMLSAWWEARTEKISPPILVNGNDLIRELGLAPGPRIGSLLEGIREAQVAGEIRSRDDALQFARNELLESNKSEQG